MFPFDPGEDGEGTVPLLKPMCVAKDSVVPQAKELKTSEKCFVGRFSVHSTAII